MPPTLGDLVPEYLDRIPEDPLTGKPLLYEVASDSYVVYSVGTDGDDDGGMLLKQNPPSSLSRFSPGEDIGMRILLQQPAGGGSEKAVAK